MRADKKGNILVVEDTSSMAELYRAYLQKAGFAASIVSSGAEALAALATSIPDAIVLDLHLPDMPGLEILKKVVNEQLPTSVVVVTTDGSIKIAVEAMRAGAYDFIVKPFNADRLVTTVGNACERALLRTQVETYRDNFSRKSFCGFVGESLAMQAVYRAIESAAPSNATIFVTGESGTGKELCAEAVHQLSRRKNGPFVAINCGAIPKELIESELFGHLKGSFTGAVADRMGAIKQADGGTLFLDEIGEMQFDLQSKLLRFLQTGTFRPVGTNRDERADLRVVCATNRDPLTEVAAGRFREDLYYRLHVVPILLPALREREDDVILIANTLLEQFAKEEQKKFRALSTPAADALRAYEWPGNVRQLQNVLRNAVIMHDAEELTVAMLPIPRVPGTAPESSEARSKIEHGKVAAFPTKSEKDCDPQTWRTITDIVALAQVERTAIERAIEICEGNVPRAAAFLGVSPSTLYRKKQSWEGL